MKTVKLRITSTGSLMLANPMAATGSKNLTYAIVNVPDDVAGSAVLRQASKICFAHAHDDDEAYSYDWSDICDKKAGEIINRYKKI